MLVGKKFGAVPVCWAPAGFYCWCWIWCRRLDCRYLLLVVGAKAGRAESENCHEIESSIKWNSINTIGGDLSHSGKKMDIWDGNQSCPGPGSQAGAVGAKAESSHLMLTGEWGLSLSPLESNHLKRWANQSCIECLMEWNCKPDYKN